MGKVNRGGVWDWMWQRGVGGVLTKLVMGRYALLVLGGGY